MLSDHSLRSSYDTATTGGAPPEVLQQAELDASEEFKAFAHLRRVVYESEVGVDILVRLAEWEKRFKDWIKPGTLRYKEGAECSGERCGPFVDLSAESVPPIHGARVYLCLQHACVHECSHICSRSQVCTVHAYAAAQQWRQHQRRAWSRHESATHAGQHFFFNAQTGQSTWQEYVLPSRIPSLCTRSTRAGIEWCCCHRAVCMARPR